MTNGKESCIMQPALGRLAQLVEHALDVRRVSGSSPLSSTMEASRFLSRCFFYFFPGRKFDGTEAFTGSADVGGHSALAILYFRGADLLVAADCSAYAYADFHNGFMAGKVTLIGCPKLDEGDYSEKLTAILRSNDIRSVTVTRMEVPCCGGLERAVRTALANAGKDIPLEVVTFSLDGNILSRKA